MLPELILDINGQEFIIPGSVSLTVAIIVYVAIGAVTLGRKIMRFWVKKYYQGAKEDMVSYYLGALILSISWLPWLAFRILVVCILRPLMIDKISKTEITRVEKGSNK